VKMLGLGVISFSCDIERYYRMTRPVISFRAIKIVMKCKHLFNFAAVTLPAMCLLFYNVNVFSSVTAACAYAPVCVRNPIVDSYSADQ
jgi:hypothetical protein